MNIFISGISGSGMGPLALMAQKAGMTVCGTDKIENMMTAELVTAGIEVEVGPQDGSFLQQKITDGKVDWFVFTSALPVDHPELVLAQKMGIRCTKRDLLIKELTESLGLKMVAVAGTHGKTTTVSMLIWLSLKLNVPVSYLVGTTLTFAPSGRYCPEAKYLLYEADEYDRNFLHFWPWISGITTVSYDHPDIYKTEAEYREAFLQFERQSEFVVHAGDADGIELAGQVRKDNAALAITIFEKILADLGLKIERAKIVAIINQFPGARRRFERLEDGFYSDYAHHPEEVAATVQMALEEAALRGKRGVVTVYEPHQNTRQYLTREGYKKAFLGVEKIYWLPTYLTREDPNLPILSPGELLAELENSELGETAEMNDGLMEKLKKAQKDGFLVLLMTAGPADQWLRERIEIL